MMEDTEAASPSTSSPSKRPAEDDANSQGQGPAQSKVRKVNSTDIHEVFTRYQYTKDGKERTGSRCNNCGYEMADINPTNLKLHVQRKHPDVHKEILARDKARQESIKTSIQGSAIAESLFVPPKEPKGKGKAKIWTPEKQKHADQLLALAVAGSCLPMSFVRDSNIKRWVSYIAPEYKLPCDKKLSTETREVAGILRKKIKDLLRAARRVNITIDIWSARLGIHSYLGVTVHYVNTKKQCRESIRLACRQFDGTHSGLTIASKLLEILKENEIDDKTFHCLTDSASNMIKGLRDFNTLRAEEEETEEDSEDPYCQVDLDNDPHFEEEIATIERMMQEMEDKIRDLSDQCGVPCSKTTRLPCIAHKVHLVVEKCVTTRVDCFGPLLKRVRAMVVKYRLSSKAKLCLLKLFEKRLPGYIISRWWTDIIMLAVFLEAANRSNQPLYHLNIEMQWGMTFTRAEIKELEKMMSIMQPMEKLFGQLNSEKTSTIHLVYPTVKAVLKTIEPLVTNESDTAHSFALEMKKQIQSYFSFLLYPTKPDFLPIYWVATFLCPVYRFVITSEEMPVVRGYLESAVSPLVSLPNPPTAASNNNLRFVLPGGLSCLSDGLTQTVSRNSSEMSARDQLDRDLEAYIRAADSHFSGLQAEAAAKASAEGKEVEEVELVAKDPLDFWFAQENSKNYKTDLPQLAQDIHSCPPTSVPSERMFSLSGCLSDARFSSILPENLENRVLVKANKFI